LADHDIELEILHRRVKHFFDLARETMYLVDEQHVALIEAADDCGQVAGPLDRRSRGRTHADAALACDDMGERGLAESRRPGEEHVVEYLATLACGLDRHAEDFPRALLPDELAKHAWTQ